MFLHPSYSIGQCLAIIAIKKLFQFGLGPSHIKVYVNLLLGVLLNNVTINMLISIQKFEWNCFAQIPYAEGAPRYSNIF